MILWKSLNTNLGKLLVIRNAKVNIDFVNEMCELKFFHHLEKSNKRK